MSPLVCSVRPPSGPALANRRNFIGFRKACEETWGPSGLAAIVQALPADVRERTVGAPPLTEWIRLDDAIAWYNAVWNGPAKRDEAVMKEHMRRTVDQGFGRVRRFFLGIATPQTLASRAAALWREEYSTGNLSVNYSEERSLTLTLRDHEIVNDPLMRSLLAEVFRHICSLTRIKNVTAVHTVRDGSLIVVLRWE